MECVQHQNELIGIFNRGNIKHLNIKYHYRIDSLGYDRFDKKIVENYYQQQQTNYNLFTLNTVYFLFRWVSVR